jgi:hypothetical protein
MSVSSLSVEASLPPIWVSVLVLAVPGMRPTVQTPATASDARYHHGEIFRLIVHLLSGH